MENIKNRKKRNYTKNKSLKTKVPFSLNLHPKCFHIARNSKTLNNRIPKVYKRKRRSQNSMQTQKEARTNKKEAANNI